jgi:hypothetical protein
LRADDTERAEGRGHDPVSEPERSIDHRMHRRAQDSILFTTMALSVIAGKVLSSAVDTPTNRRQAGASAGEHADVEIVEASVGERNALATSHDMPEEQPRSNGDLTPGWAPTGFPLMPVQSPRAFTPPCDNPTAHLGFLQSSTAARPSFAVD